MYFIVVCGCVCACVGVLCVCVCKVIKFVLIISIGFVRWLRFVRPSNDSYGGIKNVKADISAHYNCSRMGKRGEGAAHGQALPVAG